MAYVSRDPFAREELHRERVYVGSTTGCDWCGSAKQTKGGRKYLYEYRLESDGGRTSTLRGLFCCKGCLQDYNS